MADESVDNLDALGDEMGAGATPADFTVKDEDDKPEDPPKDDEPKGDEEPKDEEPKEDDKGGEKPDEEEGEDDKEDEQSEGDALDELAAPLTHDQVKDSPSFKGVLGELGTTREENKTLRAKLAEYEENLGKPSDEEADDDEDDDDETVFTRKEVGKIADSRVEKAVAKALKPYLDKSASKDHRENLVADIAAMESDKSIPKGLRLNAICVTAKKHMAEHAPALLEAIEGKPGMARELYAYGSLRVPSIQSSITKARSTHEETETERALKGASDEATEPQDFFDAAFDETAKDAE